MEPIRIMPCLDMKDGRVVKGVHFVNLKEAGDPVSNAAFYQEEGADELAMLDIAATLENRKTRLSWVQAVSAVIDIPLTVGGGIGSLEDIEVVLEAGADKVSMNSAAVRDPDLVRKAAEKFGKEKITVAIDGCRNSAMPSGFEVVVSAARSPRARTPSPGPAGARNWAQGSSSPQAWTATERKPGTTFRSPAPSPTR